MTDRERLVEIEQRYEDGVLFHAPIIVQNNILWLVALARRLLAVEEAARPGWQFLPGLRYALADLDEWRKGQE